MVKARKYAHAPITEAIIDLRVTPRESLELSTLDGVRAEEIERYPERRATIVALGALEVGAQVKASASKQETGFRFASADGKAIWQSRIDGFTFSRLAPYDRWDPFRDEANRLWRRYREATQPQRVERLAVRYINRFDLPANAADLKEYFRTSPEISPDLPQQTNGFFLQLRLPQPDLLSELLINQTVVPPPREGIVSIVLDIDLFRREEVPQEEEAIWVVFEQLHVRKNAVFEACIKERARELID